ncbi:hypothetical protein O6H91_09G087700 [Diphasiastrum complanatum]|uniref:Uncharacterized protein n=1 Tax=Diphasiastrum complanatum TaxID=34168 RepID=A0ACC2CRR8_DIPCM|nr:hypothetical protein O6H91_09G087700 [Diphasiastrum complanatum]
MITANDLYKVLSAVVPLYVAMLLAYGSVKWWKILTPEQCGGINRFVAIFAVPFLSFHIISSNNPYTMNMKFFAADSLQKVAILLVLALWARYARTGSFDWMITLFMLATLPNTLVMGIPLLAAMYGPESGSLAVQVVVLQSVIWYTLLLFLYEFRSAKELISEQFPETAASIVSFKVESDVLSLDGREPLQTEAEIGDDGKIHVRVRKSISSRSQCMMMSPRRSIGLTSMPSSKALTPRPSNLTNAEIYSMPSSRNLTPRQSSFNHTDFYSIMTGRPLGSPRPSNFEPNDAYSIHSSRAPTPRTSNFNEENSRDVGKGGNAMTSPRFSAQAYYPGAGTAHLFAPRNHAHSVPGGIEASRGSNPATALSPKRAAQTTSRVVDPRASPKMDDDPKDYMFVWSSTTSPVSEVGAHMFGGADYSAADGGKLELHDAKDVKIPIGQLKHQANHRGTPQELRDTYDEYDRDDFSFGNRASFNGDESLSAGKDGPNLTKMGSSSTAELHPKPLAEGRKQKDMPPATVMTKLIINMVWRKLIRNPNTYSSMLGLVWALISYRWHFKMPTIVENSVAIISNAGLGMAMFSLGLFMALQKKILACGVPMSLFGMVVRFITGPAFMAATSIAVGLRGVLLHVSIVQAALPQGIVPFVFAKEYNVHPDVLSTAVIFGMLVSLPITLVYYVLLKI